MKTKLEKKFMNQMVKDVCALDVKKKELTAAIVRRVARYQVLAGYKIVKAEEK